MAAGSGHSVVVKQDGSVWATRNPLVYFSSQSFVEVVSSGAKAVSAANLYIMVLKQDGSVWSTENDQHRQLVDGSTKDNSHLVHVASGAKAVAAGDSHSMILKQDGNVYATGNNDFGQLGDGSNIARKIFVRINSK